MVRSWLLASLVVLVMLVSFGLPRANGNFRLSNEADSSAAARPVSAAPDRKAATELVIYVSRDCDHCRAFQTELLTYFRAANADARIGLQLIDVDALGTGGHALQDRLDSIPTFVFMRDGREAGRIRGYPGRDRLLQAIDRFAPDPARSDRLIAGN